MGDMQSPSDAELLAEWTARRSEPAFARLVERYVALVHSAARRQVNDPHLAEEITQAVFILLARKAGSLGRQAVLAGWLCRTAHFAARDALKAERRRQHREQLAAHMDTTPDAAWQQLAPLLDEAVAQLREADRNAIVLRYYEQRPLDEVGAALGIGADAAQKRVARALEKLRGIFTRRGVTLTGAAIAGAVSANAVQAVPVGLAAKISAAALLAGTTITATTAIVMTTLHKSLITVIIVAAGMATTVMVKQHQARQTLRKENESLQTRVNELSRLTVENRHLSNLIIQAGNSRFPSNELLRLRGEVGLLRRQNAELAAQKLSVDRSDSESNATAKTAPSETEPFRSRVHTLAGFGQTLITGGWSTAAGRRTLVLVRPELGQTENGAHTITLTSTSIEIPESLLGSYGLEHLTSDSNQNVQHGQLSASPDADALLKQLAAETGAQTPSQVRITTFPGQSAQIQSVGTDGGRINVTATPNLSPDGRGFDLELDAALVPAGAQVNHAVSR